MAATLFTGLLVLLFFSTQLYAEPPRPPARAQESVMDVSLTSESVLDGYLIDVFGRILKDTPVTLVQNRKVIWSGKTNANGHFEVQGLPSGVYHVSSDQLKACCRVWAKESAPPRANRSLLLTRDVAPARPSHESRNDEFTFRISGFSTMTLPKMTTRDVRKLISP